MDTFNIIIGVMLTVCMANHATCLGAQKATK